MEETKYVQNLEQKDFKNGHLQDWKGMGKNGYYGKRICDVHWIQVVKSGYNDSLLYQ